MSAKTQISNQNKAVKLAQRAGYVAPAVDIYELNGELTLVADMPGVSSETLQVAVERGILTLEGGTKISLNGTSLFSEPSPAGYYRQFRLSEQLDAEKIDAQLENGVLTLRLPKSETALPKRIQVKTIH